MAVEQLRPLAHADDVQVIVEAGLLHRVLAEADAIVRNGQSQGIVVGFDRNIYRIGLGMADDVGQGFLHQAVAQQGNRMGQVGKIAALGKGNADVRLSAPERVEVFFHGDDEAQVVEQGRVQVDGQVAQPFQSVLHQVADAAQELFGVSVARLVHDDTQVGQHGDHGLARLIVELPGNAPPLVFAGRKELADEPHPHLFLFLQGLEESRVFLLAGRQARRQGVEGPGQTAYVVRRLFRHLYLIIAPSQLAHGGGHLLDGLEEAAGVARGQPRRGEADEDDEDDHFQKAALHDLHHRLFRQADAEIADQAVVDGAEHLADIPFVAVKGHRVYCDTGLRLPHQGQALWDAVREGAG